MGEDGKGVCGCEDLNDLAHLKAEDSKETLCLRVGEVVYGHVNWRKVKRRLCRVWMQEVFTIVEEGVVCNRGDDCLRGAR